MLQRDPGSADAAQLTLFDVPASLAGRPRRRVAKVPPPPKPVDRYQGGEGPVYACVVGFNADLLIEVYRMYLRACPVIADVTYGRGAFWKKVDLSGHTFLPSDRMTCPERPYDFRALPYENESIDAVVFDPPYMHNPGRPMVNVGYQNKETTTGFYHVDIMALYRAGMVEAVRVLRPGGLLLVKCQDEIEKSQQCRSTIEIWVMARDMGLIDQDRFTLVASRPPHIQYMPQQHARRADSVLWVFRKPKPAPVRKPRAPQPAPDAPRRGRGRPKKNNEGAN